VGSRSFLGSNRFTRPSGIPDREAPSTLPAPRAPTRRKSSGAVAALAASGRWGKALGSASWPAPQIPYACTMDEYVATGANYFRLFLPNGAAQPCPGHALHRTLCYRGLPRYASAPVPSPSGRGEGTHDVLA